MMTQFGRSAGRALTAITMTGAAIAATVAFSSPAHAVDYERFKNDANHRCLDSAGAGAHDAKAVGCNTGSYQQWEVLNEGTSDSGHRLRKLKNRATGYCLDANGAGVHTVKMKTCRESNWQIWEIFPNSDGSITFKSYGHFIHANQHNCLATAGEGDNAVEVVGCNTGHSNQQFR